MKTLFALVLAAAAVISNAALYDFETDFSITNGNPNGAWSYGYRTTLVSSRTLYNNPTSSSSTIAWRSSALGADPNFYKNITGSAFNGLDPGKVAMHPGPAGELSSLLFTVPEAGLMTLTAMFGAGDQGGVDLYVRANGLPIYTRLNTTTGESFTQAIPIPVSVGDTLEVIVGIGDGSYAFDTTPVSATINIASPVPEPATMAALGLGVFALLRRRKA